MSIIFRFFALREICGYYFPIELIDIILKLSCKINKIYAGYETSFMIIDNKTYAWGKNGHGQLGLGHFWNRPFLYEIKLLNVKKIASGKEHTIFLTTDNKVFACGSNKYGQLGITEKRYEKFCVPQFVMDSVTKIACTEYSTVICVSNMMYVCGTNYNIDAIRIPCLITEFNIKKVIMSTEYIILITEYDNVYIWKVSFSIIKRIKITNIKYINYDNDYTYILLKSGNVYAVQCLPYDLEELPSKERILKNIKSMKINKKNVLIIAKNGDIYVQGCNNHGQLGFGTKDFIQYVQKINIKNIKSATIGSTHVLALTHYDEIYSCGRNKKGELGLGYASGHRIFVPTKI